MCSITFVLHEGEEFVKEFSTLFFRGQIVQLLGDQRKAN